MIYVRQGHQRMRFRYDGAELYGLRGAKPWRRYNCDLALDANGFRNPADADAADVVVIGDSFIEGLHVEAPELMTARLAEALGRSVVNLGRTGYGPQQERNVLVRHGLDLAPKTCVWAFYEGNDLQDLHEFDANQKNLKWILDDRRSKSFYSRCFLRNSLGFAIRRWLRPDPTRPAEAYAGRFTDRAGKDVAIYFSTGIQHGDGGPKFPRGDSTELKRVEAILAEARDSASPSAGSSWSSRSFPPSSGFTTTCVGSPTIRRAATGRSTTCPTCWLDRWRRFPPRSATST